MDWVKKNWIAMVCGLVSLAGIGISVWAILGFKDVQAEANSIAAIAGTLDGLQKGAANLKTIDDAREYYLKANTSTDDASKKAKALNERKPLRDDVFPVALTADAPYSFRTAYREAFRKLPLDLKAEKAPTGDTVDRIISRMEEKARREANVTTVGSELHIPKPPDVPKFEAPVAAASPTAGRGYDERGGRGGYDDRSGGRNYDDRGGGRNYDDRGGRNYDDRGRGGEERGMPAPIQVLPRPGFPVAGQPAPQAKLPTKEELLPQAKMLATYDTARRIYTYIDDNSLEMHPIGSPSFVQAPDEVDMWAAQMFYWIEKDVIDALRKVNDQAAASLPEDQRWVAYLPVKHLVSLNISDYLTGGVTDQGGHTANIAVLQHSGQASSPRSMTAIPVSFGTASVAFTGRTGNDQFDVIHVALNLVVDARELPAVLVGLCKQNFITPLDVQYRNVDVVNAREAGYLYGSGPVVDVDIVCEMLFFRSIYDPMKPDKVKKMLAGELVDAAGGGRGAGR